MYLYRQNLYYLYCLSRPLQSAMKAVCTDLFFFISLLRIDLLTRVTREKLLSGQTLGRSDWSDITRAVSEECAAKLGRYVVVRITLTTAYTRLRRSFLVAFKLRFCFVYRTPGHMTVNWGSVLRFEFVVRWQYLVRSQRKNEIKP